MSKHLIYIQSTFSKDLFKNINNPSFDLSTNEKNWITHFIHSSPECFLKIEQNIKNIISEKYINLHEIPIIIKLLVDIYQFELTKQNLLAAQSQISQQRDRYRDDDSVQTAVTHKSETQKGLPKVNYDGELKAAEKKAIRTKVDNQWRKYQKQDYVISPAYENIMNFSQNQSLSDTYRQRMDMINNAYFSQKYK